MKKILLLSITVFVACSVFAQSNSIPNPSFENWTANPYNDPVNCITSTDQNVSNGLPINVFRDTDAYHGNYAIQMKTVKSGNDTLAGYFACGNPGSSSSGGSPVSGMPTGIRLYYQYTIKSADSAIVLLEFKKAGNLIGLYEYQIYDTTSKYVLFSQLFSPPLPEAPDTVIIAAASSSKILSGANTGNNNSNSGWAPGSTFLVDSVTLTGIATQPSNFDGDFEHWTTDTAFAIQGWTYFAYQGGDLLPIRTTDAYSGNYALELETGTSNCNSCTSLASASEVTSGKYNNSLGGPPYGGLPYTRQVDTLVFHYKYSSTTNDTAMVSMELHTAASGGNQMYYNIPLDTTSQYQTVEFPFNESSFIPDSVLITIASSSCSQCNGNLPSYCIGSILKIDSMHFKSQLQFSVTPANPAFCAGSGGVRLTASGATSYTWNPSNGLSCTNCADPLADPLTSQKYTVTATSGSLNATQTVTVSVNTPPTVNLSPASPSVCFGDSVSLKASGTAVSYTWSPSTYLNDTVASTVYSNPTVKTTYTVTGTSSAGCKGANSITVNVSALPTISISGTSTICDGSNTTLTGNGANTYVWSGGPGTANYNVAPTATTTYTVTGTNTTTTCSNTAMQTVTVNPTPTVSISGAPSLCIGPDILTASATGNGPFDYKWSTSGINDTIQVKNANTYSVTVTDANGCDAGNTFKVKNDSVPALSICMVTVDSLSKYNIIVWEKTGLTNIEKFLIYRDTANFNYALIGEVPFDSLSQFSDTIRTLYAANGDPNASSWRYTIAAMDSCGNIGPKSLYHQTIFFQNNAGNFSWSQYEIQGQTTPIPELSQYIFQRDDFSTGNFATIQTLSASSTTYTDPQYNTYKGTATWRVLTSWGISCIPTLRPDAVNYNSSKSNTGNVTFLTSVKNLAASAGHITVYPNPSSGIFTVTLSMAKGAEAVSLTVVNTLGQEINTETYYNVPNVFTRQLDLSSLAKGVYFLKLTSDNGTLYNKLVIQ
ncbi:MAG: T9SS type A sorting domain-containing protein [Bacteroidia bacterium]